MSKDDFFREIEHAVVPWKQWELYVPVFYQSITFMSVSMLAPAEKIKALLPSKRMKPYRITPWHSTFSLSAFQYRESDLGPYNELAIGIPVTIDGQTPMFTGSLRRMPDAPKMYIHHLPVTTEIARDAGIELGGFPKFLADIDFVEEDDWLSCRLKADNEHILTLRGRKVPLKRVPRFRSNPITSRRGYLLRCEWIISEREAGVSKSGQDVELELGEHEIADEIRELNPGKVLDYQYCPHAQGILTPVFESYVA